MPPTWRILRRVLLFLSLGVVANYIIVAYIALVFWHDMALHGTGIPIPESLAERHRESAVVLRPVEGYTLQPGDSNVELWARPAGGLRHFICYRDADENPFPNNARVPAPREVFDVIDSDGPPRESITFVGWPCESAFFTARPTQDVLAKHTDKERATGVFDTVRGGIKVLTQLGIDTHQEIEAAAEARKPWVDLSTFSSFARPPAPRAIPLRPIWPGLLINAATFGAAAWCLSMTRPLIRRIRHRKGTCRECGYNLAAGGQEVCPECGAS